jgi:hypothetical protein
MCSSRVPGGAPGGVPGGAPGGGPLGRPTTVAAELHAVLDALLAADLTTLAADEHAELVTALIRAQSRLHAAALSAVAAFDAADVASLSRHRTTKRWLEHRTALSLGAASHLTTLARTLRDHLPRTHAVLSRGAITPQHTAAIAEVVRTLGVEHAVTAEPILLDLARRADPATVRRATAELFARLDPAAAEKALHDAYEKRGVSLSVVGAHGYLRGVLDLESTELLQAALMPLMVRWGPDDTRSAEQRRADALLDIAKRHLDSEDVPQLGGHRPHLTVVLDADQLRAGTGGSIGDGDGWLGCVTLPWTGAALPASVARRWACDAALTPVVARLVARPPRDSAWLPLRVGRTQRTATAAQLKALAVRDGGCIHPGCSRTPAFCDAHHVVHWTDGGATDLDNLVLLCRHHHRTLHHGAWSISRDPGSPGLFWTTSPDGLRPAQTSRDRSPPMRPSAA